MKQKSTHAVSRRDFLTAVGLGGASIAALGLAACGAPKTSNNGEQDASDPTQNTTQPDNASEKGQGNLPTPAATYEADLVIVGSGTSGLAAAVQAGYEGANTIVIEKRSTYGGNASAVEALFAVGDRLAAEQNVEYTVADVVHRELEYSNYRTSGNLWSDLVENSEENYYWLVDQDVKFSGIVGKGSGLIPVAHVFETSPEDGLYPYATPMYEKAVSLGIDFRFNQAAFKLSTAPDGSVNGVYAKDATGEVTLYTAKAVILASGGFACNPDLFARTGWFGLADEFLTFVVAENDGAGYEMAHELGAGDTVPWACGINTAYVLSLGDKNAPGRTVSTSPFVVWLNQNGARFVNEDFAVTTNRQAVANPLRNQLGRYVAVDRGTVETILADKEGMLAQFDEVVASGPDDLFVGDTWEDVAKAAGLDGAAVANALQTYNRYAADGKDAQFLKGAEYLRVMDQPPFYLGNMTLGTCATFGGIMTNDSFEVVTPDFKPISGLYAVGTDGCMLYRDTYTICVPTSAAAHHVNSGRRAVMNALGSPAN